MTVILNRSPEAKDFVTGGQETVGLRVPDHVVALALLDAAKQIGVNGIAAPSANRFGHVSPTTADAVREELDQYLSADDIILDGGASQVGVESTIIDCTGNNPHILRPGAITQAMIEEVTALKVTEAVNEIRVSGSLENHYAPEATVVLDTTPQSGDGYIAMSDQPTPAGVIRLASPQSVEEYARILYASLRDGDSQKLTRICIDQPQGDGLAIAICDRLQRAARGR
jgi:L-threonylcarbamoyladenylate synthase